MNQPYDCSQPVEIEDEPHHHLIIANEYVRALAVEIPPGVRTLCHHHPHDYLLYVASGAAIISAARDEEPKQLNYVDGECELSKAGLVHVVENLDDKAFRNVVVELLEPLARLRRGPKPALSKGNAQIEQILEEEPGAIFSVTMEAAAELEISGPSVIASPHGGKIMMKELDEFDIPLDDFAKLIWVCARRKGGIRNAGLKPAQVVVFQTGGVS
jgi:quercetin dioxygenase-like cupin family protein